MLASFSLSSLMLFPNISSQCFRKSNPSRAAPNFLAASRSIARSSFLSTTRRTQLTHALVALLCMLARTASCALKPLTTASRWPSSSRSPRWEACSSLLCARSERRIRAILNYPESWMKKWTRQRRAWFNTDACKLSSSWRIACNTHSKWVVSLITASCVFWSKNQSAKDNMYGGTPSMKRFSTFAAPLSIFCNSLKSIL